MNGVIKSAVVGIPSADFGERVITAVKSAGNPSAVEALIAAL
jgi:hypothetical protein